MTRLPVRNTLAPLATPYSLIIGYRPSNGARSPSVWNHYFKASGTKCYMYPADLDNVDELECLLRHLADDSLFLGAAVAAPYKTSVCESTLVRVSDSASLSSSSVNCIYRSHDGSLEGVNTDALAFLYTLEEIDLDPGSSVFIYGLGSTGRAIASLLSETFSVSAFNRSYHPHISTFCQTNNIRLLDSPPSSLHSFTMVVNSTIVGSSQFNSQDLLLFDDGLVSTAPSSLIYYDINYMPPVTIQSQLFASHGNRTHNGLNMNQVQAYIALSHVMNKPLSDITQFFIDVT